MRGRASGQEALGYYAWNPAAACYLPFALNVLTLRGSLISNVTAFLARSTEIGDPDMLVRLPQVPIDPARLRTAFDQMGLPAYLD